jgi:pimeloyl-ACP methyl ester carboxylesterase
LARGVHNDVDDLETVRCHFGISHVDLIGHSYLGLIVILYPMKYPAYVTRVVQMANCKKKGNPRIPSSSAKSSGTFCG